LSAVRPFAEDDVPQVADLNWRVLHDGEGPSPPALRSYFQELFLHNPWFDKALPSLVYEDKGKIVGFLGVVPRRMSVRGEPIRVAYGSNFVVDPNSRSTLAGLHLVRALLSGEQDLSMSDSANDLSRKVQRALGLSTVLLDSIHWSRPLRPTLYALFAMSRSKKSTLSICLRSAAKPFCSAVDSMAARISSSPFRQTVPRLSGEELDVETLLECVSEFSRGYSLRPEYDVSSLSWLLSFMDRMKAYGGLRKVILRDERKTIVGWYIYCIRGSGIGEVVQIGAAQQSATEILDHLFNDAWKHGAIALHGRLDSRLIEELSEKGCFFYRRGGWMQVHSRRPELLQLIRNGDAFLTRLDGEWCLAFSG